MILDNFIGPILEIVKRVIPDPAERARIEADLNQAVVDAEARLAEAQATVVVAEATGSTWQRSWRPALMYFLMFVVAWHMICLPVIAAVAGVQLEALVGLSIVPGEVWTLLTVGMGGYIGGRSLEKVAKALGGKS